MFTWVNGQHVRSSKGFEVASVDRFSMQYREGGQVLTIPVEVGSFGGGPSVSIPANAFQYWDGYRVPNTPEKQQEMRRNFKAALEFQGTKLEE